MEPNLTCIHVVRTPCPTSTVLEAEATEMIKQLSALRSLLVSLKRWGMGKKLILELQSRLLER